MNQLELAPLCWCGALPDENSAAAFEKPGLCGANMTLEERVDLVLAVARVLFVNGQSTEQTLAAAERLGDALGLHAKVIPRWGELQFQSLANDARLISAVSADPTNVAMGRVASAMRAVDDLSTGRIKPVTPRRRGSGPSPKHHRHRHGYSRSRRRRAQRR